MAPTIEIFIRWIFEYMDEIIGVSDTSGLEIIVNPLIKIGCKLIDSQLSTKFPKTLNAKLFVICICVL